MRCDLEAHRQLANQLTIDLHLRVTESADLVCLNELHSRVVSRHTIAYCVRQQTQVTKPVRRLDNTNFKLRFIQSRARRYRKIAAVTRRFSDCCKRRRVLTPIDLEFERTRTPRREMTQTRDPEGAFADSFLQPRSHVTHD